MTIVKNLHKIPRKLRWIYVHHSHSINNSDNLIEARIDERYSQYYAKKYQSFLTNLPKYRHTHKYSNKIWWCWLQGEDKAPKLCQACLASIRKNLPDREVIVITEENFADYVDIPEFILEKYHHGTISHTHFSDILRLELLVKHGGTWIDSSVLVTEKRPEYFDQDLFMFKNLLKENSAVVSSSWFISAEVENPILKTTLDLLHHYWQHNEYLDRYFLFHILLALATHKYPTDWENVPTFSNVPPHVLQFEITKPYSKERFQQICQMSGVHKLTQKADFSKAPDNSFYHFILKTYLPGGKK